MCKINLESPQLSPSSSASASAALLFPAFLRLHFQTRPTTTTTKAAPTDAGGEQLLETTTRSSCREDEEVRRKSAGAACSGGIDNDESDLKDTTTTGAHPSWFTAVAHRVWSTGPLLVLKSALGFSIMDACAKSAGRRLPVLQAVAARVAFMLPVNTLVLWRNGIDFSDTRTRACSPSSETSASSSPLAAFYKPCSGNPWATPSSSSTRTRW